ncbi:hypothetical protein Btru_076497 [Bulinus truncatus]|nr:hypothetical protein Btru_076497 [Bulinus truncatus]
MMFSFMCCPDPNLLPINMLETTFETKSPSPTQWTSYGHDCLWPPWRLHCHCGGCRNAPKNCPNSGAGLTIEPKYKHDILTGGDTGAPQGSRPESPHCRLECVRVGDGEFPERLPRRWSQCRSPWEPLNSRWRRQKVGFRFPSPNRFRNSSDLNGCPVSSLTPDVASEVWSRCRGPSVAAAESAKGFMFVFICNAIDSNSQSVEGESTEGVPHAAKRV